MTLKVETIVNGPFQENCFIAYDDTSMKGVFIDPGAEPERLMKTASRLGVEIVGILNTHGHIDHAGGVAIIKDTLKVPFAMHPDDDFLLKILPDQAAMFGVEEVEVPTIDIPLKNGDTFPVGSLEAKVLHTPGHTPGGLCFLFGDIVFVGDTLFAGSVGRTDLPGGSTQALLDSIQTRLMCLDDNVRAYSGHGPSTTIGVERRRNPFLNGMY
jgi:glyoxylase-like metal-dependent hydrolase (beta-lactamase superfamily II)